VHSIVRGNTATSNGGGGFLSSSHARVSTQLTLVGNSEISNNKAALDGGGIAVRGGEMEGSGT